MFQFDTMLLLYGMKRVCLAKIISSTVTMHSCPSRVSVVTMLKKADTFKDRAK